MPCACCERDPTALWPKILEMRDPAGIVTLVFPWQNGTTYKILVGAKAKGDHTIFSGYYFDEQKQQWKLLAQWDKSKTGGQLLSKLYAFVENFGPNGDDYFEGRYGNQWVCTVSGKWIEITRCSFTTYRQPG